MLGRRSRPAAGYVWIAGGCRATQQAISQSRAPSPAYLRGTTLTEYRVALTLERSLDEQEIRGLLEQRSESISDYEMDGENMVVASLNAADSLTGRDTAELQLLRATGVKIRSAQLIP